MSSPPRDVTGLLLDLSHGSQRAADQLLPLVYDQLRSLARHYLRAERPDHTLQSTGLVHEAYPRLVGADDIAWESRGHFYRLAALAMRRILVDSARQHRAMKRGGGWQKVSLSAADGAAKTPDLDLLALDEAMTRLAAFDAQKNQIVELHFFGGLTTQETAQALGLSKRTVERGWTMAKAWLYREIESGHGTTRPE